MKNSTLWLLICTASLIVSCGDKKETVTETAATENTETGTPGFEYQVEQFADVKVLRYQIPGWEALPLQKQKLIYYLTEAGLAGRDIMWDQNYRHNLKIRKAMEQVYTTYTGDKGTEDWKQFETYLKRIWFSNGIHHHYSTVKMKPGYSKEYLRTLLDETGADLTGEAFEVLFNDKDAKKVNLDKDADIVLESAVNFYGPDVTDAEVEKYYAAIKVDENEPIEKGLNSKLVKENGKLTEKVYKSGGLYGTAIDQIIKWLHKAKEVAENENQATAIGLLIDYYTTGSLDTWDDYAVAWVNATEGDIDWINGFIEVY
ncbi:MAG: dipeptidyl-peptidase 3 family protein, partial [Marinirhabdus sp.]